MLPIAPALRLHAPALLLAALFLAACGRAPEAPPVAAGDVATVDAGHPAPAGATPEPPPAAAVLDDLEAGVAPPPALGVRPVAAPAQEPDAARDFVEAAAAPVPRNTPPRATSMQRFIAAGESLLFRVSIEDDDGDAVTLRVLEWPAHGTLVQAATPLSFRYQPTPGFTGVDRIALVPNDGLTDGAVADVSVHVERDVAAYDPADDAIHVPMDGRADLDVYGTDDLDAAYDRGYADARADARREVPDVRVVIIEAPRYGRLLPGSGYGGYHYVPFRGFIGDDIVVYCIERDGWRSRPARWHFTVGRPPGGHGERFDEDRRDRDGGGDGRRGSGRDDGRGRGGDRDGRRDEGRARTGGSLPLPGGLAPLPLAPGMPAIDGGDMRRGADHPGSRGGLTPIAGEAPVLADPLPSVDAPLPADATPVDGAPVPPPPPMPGTAPLPADAPLPASASAGDDAHITEGFAADPAATPPADAQGSDAPGADRAASAQPSDTPQSGLGDLPLPAPAHDAAPLPDDAPPDHAAADGSLQSDLADPAPPGAAEPASSGDAERFASPAPAADEAGGAAPGGPDYVTPDAAREDAVRGDAGREDPGRGDAGRDDTAVAQEAAAQEAAEREAALRHQAAQEAADRQAARNRDAEREAAEQAAVEAARAQLAARAAAERERAAREAAEREAAARESAAREAVAAEAAREAERQRSEAAARAAADAAAATMPLESGQPLDGARAGIAR